MNYELRHFDTPLLRFTAEPSSASCETKITWVNQDQIALLPIGFEATNEGLSS